jgi:EAL domain-containing protein (putative c-di-GMP-specific phosphodiesterase class I)
MQKGLADDLINTLKKYNISPDKINLEITETAAAYSQQIMDDNIKALTDAGIKLSLDDFGTGYSNMKRIASLPLHIVKLDKTFTDIEDNQNLTIVLKNTIRMIKDMNMKIVVEGVETEDLVKKFSDYKCDYIQGYYFSKPVPKKDFIAFVESRNL